ncbi:glycogen/starch/alpha-glucan phosphorylase [Anaerococcus sp. Marseille-P9784]|uniref:glycogen/starch/alpha-glucan phosphorylase n=1 Tax=Anaerococcus sp. Marseille-P9784 TaxID=2614127 RepID=UPI00124ADD15|nr:glycogen/starch/alpha-glucan phosphorylase [Anaerococcus sp. Marseille-P9784]
MKNQKSKLLAITLSASFVLSSIAPATAKASSIDMAQSSYYVNLDPDTVNPEIITDLISKAEGLKNILKHKPNAKVYEHALDIIINVLKRIDPAKAANKVKLASESIDAIKFSIEDIQVKNRIGAKI